MAKKYIRKTVDEAKQQKNFRRTIWAIAFVLTITVVTVIGTSYAVFSTSSKGSEMTVQAGTFQITFTEGNVISLTNAYPMTDAQGKALTAYTFTVKNTGTVPASYQVYLEPDGANTLVTSQIKYTIQKGTATESSPALLSTLADGKTFYKDQSLASNESATFSIKLWVNEEAGNEVQGKSYKAKVVVSSVVKPQS